MTHAFIGLMVLYRLTEEEALATNKRREDVRQNLDKMREEHPGFQAHVGNPIGEFERVPMIVTAICMGVPTKINGQCILDGNDSLWVTSAQEGTQPGEWEAIMDG